MGNGSHASTLKSPSYTKSVSWQHYRIFFHSSPGYMQELTTILAYMGIFALDAHYERGSQTSFQTIKSMLSRYLYRGRN
ncbi:Crp/Fnr family transcriptional regulator [Klebsiella pneumoniae]|uniref:Crp/Fnr family transcriptional regulator n=1 Tax=Klebsiella pneumoniae TaxID=573 RepID=A0A2X1QMT6_KLEPN|nr:Crp/Fnr family transcriptional regulator [Klebsiella pneumoniae]